MSHTRFDLYRPIHQALRAALSTTLIRLGALDPVDTVERQETLSAIDALLGLVDSHLHHEEEFLHPLLQAAAPASPMSTEAEHAAHRAEIADLRGLMATAERYPSDASVFAIYRAYARFVAENYEHMHDEETRLNALLWENYSDAELMRVQGQLVGSIPPGELMATLRFMLPALNPEQRDDLVGGMPSEALGPVMALAAEVLEVKDYARLKSRTMLAA